MKEKVREYQINDNGVFPNSKLPVLHYIHVLDLPFLFPARYVRRMFRKNDWKNNWRQGIFTYSHYHSITHEAMGVIKGQTTLLLGGNNGQRINIAAGDVLIIPAGVAHKNLGKENDVVCIGGYPKGMKYDMNYGKPKEERPGTDRNIAQVPLPETDPVYADGGVVEIWRNI